MKYLTVFVALCAQLAAIAATPLESMLDLASAAAGRTVSLSGRASASDGAGGMFSIITDDGRATNAGTVFRSTVNTNLLFVRQDTTTLNVSWFGAVVDGVTDDTTAVQAAFTVAKDNGQSVMFSGMCYTTAELTLWPGTKLVGLEKTECGIKSSNNIVQLNLESDDVLSKSVSIENMTFRHYGTDGTNINAGTPLSLFRMENVVIDNGSTYAGDGLVIADASTATPFEIIIRDSTFNHFHDSAAKVLSIIGSEIWITGCKFTSQIADHSALLELNSVGWLHFYNNGLEGVNIYAQSCHDGQISGNLFSSPWGTAITLFNCERFSVVDNKIIDIEEISNTARGITLSGSGSSYALISGNIIKTASTNPNSAGIYETGSLGDGYAGYNRIIGNDFTECDAAHTSLAATSVFLDVNDQFQFRTPVNVGSSDFTNTAPFHLFDTDPRLIIQKPFGDKGVQGELVFRAGGDNADAHTNRAASVAGYISTNSPGYDYVGLQQFVALGGTKTLASTLMADNGYLALGNAEPTSKLHLMQGTLPAVTIQQTNAPSIGDDIGSIKFQLLQTDRTAEITAYVPTGSPGTDYEGLRFDVAEAAVKKTALRLESTNAHVPGKLTAHIINSTNGINPGALAADPGSPSNGDIWYNGTTHKYMGWADGALFEFNDPDFDVSNITQANIGTTQISGTNFVNTVVVTNYVTAPLIIADTIRQNVRSDLTHAGTVTLDFATNTSQFLVLTGNVTLAASNLGTNRSYYLLIANAQATNCAVSYPAETLASGFNPASVAAGKHLHLWFSPHPTTNTIVFCSAAEQP